MSKESSSTVKREHPNSEFASRFLQIFPVVPDNLVKVTMDTWCKEMVAELVTVARESSPHIATTAL